MEHSTGGVIAEWISTWERFMERKGPIVLFFTCKILCTKLNRCVPNKRAVKDTKKISTILNDTINMNAKHL